MTLQNLLDYKGKQTKYERKIRQDMEYIVQPIVANAPQVASHGAWVLWTLQQQSAYTAEYIRTKGNLKAWDSYQLRKLVRVLKDTILMQYNTIHKQRCKVQFACYLNPWGDAAGELRAKGLLLDAYMQELTKREILHTDVQYATPCQIAAAVGHATDLQSHLYCEDLY